ncbi:Crp/Fnr family transcriptional regulator [Hyphococcus sp.]|uniref:Crp/Fnr family transcriptional regulator n=1 Tax=Hyphococcus sp. TaxID=2038636 RepID=UPI00207D8DAA|nr:MAG: hypothetical protein DHS20C04_16610 [Marinicaulis sp.]
MADLLDFGGAALGNMLSADLRQRLSAAATPMRYGDGETIHSRGDAKPGLSMVRSGAVRFAIPGEDGSWVTTSILGPEHCFGEATLFAGLPRAYDAIAVGETVVEQLTKRRFDAIFDEEPELARALLAATTQRLYASLSFLDDQRRLPLKLRMAKIIVSMARSAKRANVVECNQSDFAFTLGVSRVSAGKALGELQDVGFIRLGYGQIEITGASSMHAWILEHDPLAPLTEL